MHILKKKQFKKFTLMKGFKKKTKDIIQFYTLTRFSPPIVVLDEIELFQLLLGYFPLARLSDLYNCCVYVTGIRPPVVSVALLNTNGLTSH
jgi:hypothetical protein